MCWEKVFANVSAGADTKANTRELVRARSSQLERLQRRVALEALGERGSSFGTEAVFIETVRERWGENGQRAGVSAGADTKANAL